MIDNCFRTAAGFALAACLMSLVGIIHAPSLQWPGFSPVSIGYLITAGFLFFYPMLQKGDALEETEAMTADRTAEQA